MFIDECVYKYIVQCTNNNVTYIFVLYKLHSYRRIFKIIQRLQDQKNGSGGGA